MVGSSHDILPEEMSDEDVRRVVLDTMSNIRQPFFSMKDMGIIIPNVTKQVNGRADKSVIAKIVKQEINKRLMPKQVK